MRNPTRRGVARNQGGTMGLPEMGGNHHQSGGGGDELLMQGSDAPCKCFPRAILSKKKILKNTKTVEI